MKFVEGQTVEDRRTALEGGADGHELVGSSFQALQGIFADLVADAVVHALLSNFDVGALRRVPQLNLGLTRPLSCEPVTSRLDGVRGYPDERVRW